MHIKSGLSVVVVVVVVPELPPAREGSLGSATGELGEVVVLVLAQDGFLDLGTEAALPHLQVTRGELLDLQAKALDEVVPPDSQPDEGSPNHEAAFAVAPHTD